MPQPLNLLIFNLMTDADAPGQGFNTAWINALAQRCATVDVLTMGIGRLALRENVRVFSVGREKGYSEPRRLLKFYRTLSRLLREKCYDACFAHMQPLFADLAAPLLLPRRIPITLWYAHKAVTPKLWLAEKVARHVVTPSPESFRIHSRKVRVVGHGVDTDLFAPADPYSTSAGAASTQGAPFTILSVSRIAPIKRLETLIAAAALLRDQHGCEDFQVRIVGNTSERDQDYTSKLYEQVAILRLDAIVHFDGALSQTALPEVYRAADVFVNLSDTGSVDKAVLEALACGVPAITANVAFRKMLALWGETLLVEADAAQLAQRIMRLRQRTFEDRCALGLALREIVVRDHSLARLADLLVGEVFLA